MYEQHIYNVYIYYFYLSGALKSILERDRKRERYRLRRKASKQDRKILYLIGLNVKDRKTCWKKLLMHNSLELENKKYILVHKGKQNLFFQVHLKYDRLFYLLLMILYFFYLVFFCYHQFIIPYLYFCIYFSVSVVFLTYRVVLRTA